MTSLSRHKSDTTVPAPSARRWPVFGLSCLLASVTGAVAFGDPAAPAPIYPQAAHEEPVFISSKKPLPAPAQLAEPVNVEIPVLAPVLPPAPVVAPPPIEQPTIVRTQAGRQDVPAVAPVDPLTRLTEPQNVVESLKELQILLEPPSPQALFYRLDSDKSLEARMRQQALQRKPPDTVHFPEQPIVSTDTFKPREFARQLMIAEPTFVTYNRLYFEDKNSERYGWDLGAIQPIISGGKFVADYCFFPYKFASKPFHRGDTSAGECWPGDPVPYILYPPEISITGSLFESAVLIGVIAIFP